MSEVPATKKTILHDLHVELGAKMVPFAGYDMPVQYPAGILKEHLHTRSSAGLFDVSHMGQLVISGDDPATAIEKLIPGDIQALAPGEMRYSFLTNKDGGILDDLIVTRREKDLFVVVNAACKEHDIALLEKGLTGKAEVRELKDRTLVALQGPKAATVLSRYADEVKEMPFMTFREISLDGIPCFVTRSGYTGEDGYEISIPNEHAVSFYRKLLAEDEVAPIGLGARDSLRLEAAMKRVGILPEGRAPAREHTEIADEAGNVIGEVTSGGYSPCLEAPIAMGYVPLAFSAVGTKISLLVRGKARVATVAKMPFVEQRYYRG